jgi:putative membrane protein
MKRTFAPLILLLTSSAWAAEPAPLSDAQIAHIAYTAGQIDIDAAKLALDKASTPTVREFAQTMLRDHEAVNQQALALVAKLKVTPQDNPTSQALSEAAATARASQATLDGTAFDRAYIAGEAAYHQQVNEALRTLLIPGAQNPELKSLLEDGLALFSEHQKHAEVLAAKQAP